MKRILFLLITFLAFSLIYADEVKVTMKNGTVFTGELKDFVPTDHVTVIVAGIETTIPISEVASVERPEAIQTTTAHKENGDGSKLQYGKYAITDTKQYPDSFVLHIGNQNLTMVLVRGGWFNMGYDDRHSLSMKSEPVHQVNLSSYYVSEEFISRSTARRILNNIKIKKGINQDSRFSIDKWEQAYKLVQSIAIYKDMPFRMLTEAEWEYVSLMPFAKDFFGTEKYAEWCSDYFGEFDSSPQVNPTGPSTGKSHITRSFNARRNKWDRSLDDNNLDKYVRIAINASDVTIDRIQRLEESSKKDGISNETEIEDSYYNGDADAVFRYRTKDTRELPDSFALSLGDRTILMRLVRGGTFLMGYDGAHSSSMNSEPVHSVTVDSYFISTTPITKLNGVPYDLHSWQEIENLVEALSKTTVIPIRIPTEAEWEYASIQTNSNEIFDEKNSYYEWVSDYWGNYPEEPQINPTGPTNGRYHILRSFSKGKKARHKSELVSIEPEDKIKHAYDYEYYVRSKTKDHAYIRLVVNADDYIKSLE